MQLPLIRPATPTDLNILMQFAKESGYGITSLPRHSSILEKKIHASERALREKTLTPLHETYLFCLEWEGEVIGTSGITSRIGMTEPFFAFHLLHESQVCPYLGINRRIPVLNFMRARKKPTEIGSLFLAKPFRNRGFGKLLSLSRFLFIASFRNRFASVVIAELRGINHHGVSPFWEAIGRHFFQIDFPEADLLRMEHHACIEELFPKHPIYVDLLPKEAQDAISAIHSDTLPVKRLLEKQGFKISHYLDLFDGGPHMYAPTDDIHAVRESKEARILAFRPAISQGSYAIISNAQLDYRATFAPLLIEDNHIICQSDVASVLQVSTGSLVRYYTLPT